MERRKGDEQQGLREENLREGKKMKTYTSKVLGGLAGERLEGLVRRAVKCRAQVLAAATGVAGAGAAAAKDRER